MPNYKRLTPFKRCVLQNFPFIEADFDALTNYGLLCKIVEYLNNVISSQNEVQANVEALNNAFIELKNYVDNFFDNPNFKQIVEESLDEMAESGALSDIMGESQSCFYNVQVDEKYYASTKTHYKVITIPKLDAGGNAIKVKLGVANDQYSHPVIGETVRSYSKRHLTTAATNGGYANVDISSPIYGQPDGVVIRNGEVIVDNTAYMSEQRQRLWYFAVLDNGNLTCFEPVTPAQDMIDAGVYNAVLGEVPLVVGGQNFHTVNPDVPSGSCWTTPYPHSVWGQKSNGDYIVFICNGKGDPDEQGISLNDIANILITDYDAQFAMGLDPGGSAQATYKAYPLNLPGDTYWTKERNVATIVYIGKDLPSLTSWQKMESSATNYLSDVAYDSKNRNVFDSGFISLKCLDNDVDFSGIECFQKEKRTKLFMSPTNLYYNRYDENNAYIDNLFSATESGFISTNKGRMAHIPAILPLIDTDDDPQDAISNINYLTGRYCPSSTSEKANGDEPYSDAYAIVFNIPTTSANYREQIAFPIGSAANTHVPVRRYYSDDSWTAWSRYDSSKYPTEWTSLTTTKGTAKYRVSGNMVEVRVSVTSGQSGVIAIMPEALRPADNLTVVACASGNNMAKAYILHSNGNIGLNTPDNTSAGNYAFNITYIIG